MEPDLAPKTDNVGTLLQCRTYKNNNRHLLLDRPIKLTFNNN